MAVERNIYLEMCERFDDEWQANEVAESVIEGIRSGEPFWVNDGYVLDEWGNEVELELVEW